MNAPSESSFYLFIGTDHAVSVFLDSDKQFLLLENVTGETLTLSASEMKAHAETGADPVIFDFFGMYELANVDGLFRKIHRAIDLTNLDNYYVEVFGDLLEEERRLTKAIECAEYALEVLKSKRGPFK